MRAAGAAIQNLTEIPIPAVPAETGALGAVPAPSTPADICRRASAGYRGSSESLRAGEKARRQSRAAVRERLRGAAPNCSPRPVVPSEPGKPGIFERTLIADMFGTVSLFDHDLSARFEEGRMTGITLGDRPALCGRPVSSYYIEDNHRYDFTRDGAFSFEGENIHGLRAYQSIRGNGVIREGSVVYDFFFLGGESSLFISTVCDRPRFSPDTFIERWATLELPLFEFSRSEAVSIEAKAPDGELSRTDLPGCRGSYLFAGTAFRVSNGRFSVFITYPESELKIFHILPVVIERPGKKTILSISPGGCYLPSSSGRYTGFADHTVFAIDIQESDTDVYPRVGSKVFSQTGPPWCRFTG